MLKFIKALYLLVNVIIIVALLTLHFFIKDTSFKSSIYFYSFPLPIILLIVLILSIFLGKRRKYNLILVVILCVIWLGRSFRISFSSEIKENDLEVVFWNAARNDNFEGVLKTLEKMPDVMVLTETNQDNLDSLKLKHPKYYFYNSSRELQIFSKTPLIIVKEETSKFKSTVIHFITRGIDFFAVDMMGSPDVPKSWGFNFVNPLIDKTNNAIVLGDFNVPLESIFSKKFKLGYKNAFLEKGNGFIESWPNGIPLLSLDHIWVSKDLEVLKTEKIHTFKSDHSMLKTFVRK
jgi:Ca2+/Na+ antiporter